MNAYPCPECGFVASRACALGSHRYWKHGVPGKTYPPPVMGGAFVIAGGGPVRGVSVLDFGGVA